jgi:peptide/nickel transport system permease protein
MIAFLVRRLAVSLLVMLLVSFLTFGIIWLVPGDAASAFLDTSATPEQLQQIRHQLGLDQPFYEQMLSWYVHLLHGDLGNSIFLRRSVVTAIIERLPVTLSLTAIALALEPRGGQD